MDNQSEHLASLEEIPISRRRLLKALVAAGGATAAASLLPGKWSKPLAKVGVLPAHAQISPTPPPLGTGDLQVTLTWNNGTEQCGEEGAVDVDLHVVEPDDTRVYYGNDVGPTAELDFDNVCGFGPENIFVAAGEAAAGTYRAQVVYYGSYGTFEGAPTTATIRITVFADTPSEQVHTFTRIIERANSCIAYNVADIVFPAGTVTEQTGTEDLCARGIPMTK
jgi:hypothetical protein